MPVKRGRTNGVVFHGAPMATFDLSYGEFRFLNLDALIASKRAVGRERDLAVVRVLIAIKDRASKNA